MEFLKKVNLGYSLVCMCTLINLMFIKRTNTEKIFNDLYAGFLQFIKHSVSTNGSNKAHIHTRAGQYFHKLRNLTFTIECDSSAILSTNYVACQWTIFIYG